MVMNSMFTSRSFNLTVASNLIAVKESRESVSKNVISCCALKSNENKVPKQDTKVMNIKY